MVEKDNGDVIPFTAMRLNVKEFTTQMISGTSKVEQQESNFAIGDRVHKYYGFKYLAIKHAPKIEKKHCVVCSHVNGLSEDTCWNCKNKLVDINV